MAARKRRIICQVENKNIEASDKHSKQKVQEKPNLDSDSKSDYGSGNSEYKSGRTKNSKQKA